MTNPVDQHISGGTYFDGDRPVPRPVISAILTGDSLEISLEDGDIIRWPKDDVRELPDTAGRGETVVCWSGDPVARLVTPVALRTVVLPDLLKPAPPKGRARLAAWALAAVAAVALQVFVLIPRIADQLATFIPPGGERALGNATLGQIRSLLDTTGIDPIPFCEYEPGLAALTEMNERLNVQQDGAPIEISLYVLDHKMINAFALPGGIVVLFRGLIDAAESPDEVAAVLAHEIGHVASRDPTRNALRSTGSIGILGLLLGDFAGGAVVLMLAEQLVNAQYTQEAESEADHFAAEVLRKADISPTALATFFERLQGENADASELIGHFQSHPALGDRIAAAQAAVDDDATTRPALDVAAWLRLQQICKR